MLTSNHLESMPASLQDGGALPQLQQVVGWFDFGIVDRLCVLQIG